MPAANHLKRAVVSRTTKSPGVCGVYGVLVHGGQARELFRSASVDTANQGADHRQ